MAEQHVPEAFISFVQPVQCLQLKEIDERNGTKGGASDLKAFHNGPPKLAVHVSEAQEWNWSCCRIRLCDPEQVEHTRLVKMDAANDKISALLATRTFAFVGVFDQRINLTNRVLDRTIQAVVDRVHPFVGPNRTTYVQARVDRNRKRNMEAVQEHYRVSVRLSRAANESECGVGFGN